MMPEKLGIILEREGNAGSRPVFDDSRIFLTALFNPKQLAFNKSANWQKQDPKEHDNPELQFTNSEPRTLSLDLFFDTYDTPDAAKEDVRRKYTDAMMTLITIDGDKHRPPVCRLTWGRMGIFFQGVLEKLGQQFTLFAEDGTPVRATLSCTFKEWWTNYDDLNQENLRSSDIARVRTVRRGDTLTRLAAEEFGDPKLWRAIAVENHIDDPLALVPGQALLIPTLSRRRS